MKYQSCFLGKIRKQSPVCRLLTLAREWQELNSTNLVLKFRQTQGFVF